MALSALPPGSSLVDQQFVQISGPNGIISSYQFDAQQQALYFKESQVIFPSFHGATHIAEDPVPIATCDTPGLMAADDKCKLDAFLQTRLGVLGFQGAGFPDDGGWMHGDIILAAGTEFISLERIGNVIRFTVDSPIPLNCSSEECTQIYWIQDSTDISSIRPPTCSGKLPGTNIYGEMKIYLFPESTITDPTNPATTLNNKGQYPAFIFKRYDDAIAPGTAEHEMILKRDNLNPLVTEIGWAMTPGAIGVPEMVWFMGKDDDGGQIRFNLEQNSEPGLLGSLLYNGHLMTKKMGVITNYSATILSTNQYTIREWNVDAAIATGDAFTAHNIWQYENPENPTSGDNPQTLILDIAIDLLPIGTLVDIWAFKVGEVAGEPILRYYFNKKPSINPNNIWTWVANTQFGDVAMAREEIAPGAGSEDKDASTQVSSIRTFERNLWGLTGYDDPLIWYDESTAGDLTQQHKATIDTTLPGLVVLPSQDTVDNFSERPVWLWNRHNYCNSINRIDIGCPNDSNFVPLDFVFRAQIDEHENRYMRIIETGIIDDSDYVRVSGVHFHDLPPFGDVRIISPGTNPNDIYNYSQKFVFPSGGTGLAGSDDIILVGDGPYPGSSGDIVELLHQEYNAPIVRVELAHNTETGLVELQFKVGVLDMGSPYEEDIDNDADDFVRGLAPGYAVSAVYSQAGTFTGVGTQPSSSPDGFIVYDGGAQVGGAQNEYWNRLEVMVRDSQVWIWWNQLLIPPSAVLSASLSTPVTITTPYFTTIVDPDIQFGKNGLRMWPGSKLRRMDIRTQTTLHSEFTWGQLAIT